MIRNLPNIVFVTVDAWRFDALGIAPDERWLARYGLDGRLATPNLDRFASQGVYFTQALSSSPHTTSSHASIMSGLFPPHHGVRSFLYERLPDDIETLAQRLSRLGYETIALREIEHQSEPSLLEKVDVLRGFNVVVHTLEDFARRSAESIGTGRPVFAFLHLWDIHAPYLYSSWAKQNVTFAPAWEELQAIANASRVDLPAQDRIGEQEMMQFQREVAGQIQDTEQCIQLLSDWYVRGVNWFDQYRWPVVEETLRTADLSDNTVVFVYGDHGEGVHPDGKGTNTFTHGQSLLDDVLRVPLVIWGLPGFSGNVIDQQVSLVDLAPTVLELTSQNADDNYLTNESRLPGGRSLMPVISGADHEGGHIHYAELCLGSGISDKSQISQQYIYQTCVRSEHFKVLRQYKPVLMKRYMNMGDRLQRRLRHYSSRILSYRDQAQPVDSGQEFLLFWSDLRNDPDEMAPNRWKRFVPDTVKEMKMTQDELIDSAVRGPAIDLEKLAETAVLDRLIALGYIDQV